MPRTPRNVGSNFGESGSILPPDIFMGLHFNQQGDLPSTRELGVGSNAVFTYQATSFLLFFAIDIYSSPMLILVKCFT
jgi:hypothetical protein